MYQESEQSIWKPVLGALCAASVILTIVGNLVFSTKPSIVPTLSMAKTEFENNNQTGTDPGPPAEQVRRIEPATAAHTPSKTAETIVTQPRAVESVEVQKTPCDSMSDVLVAEESPLPGPAPKSDDEVVGQLAERSSEPVQTEIGVLVAERAPVAEPAPLPEEAPLPEQVPQAVDTVATLSIASAPVNGPELVSKVENHASADAARPEPEAIHIAGNCDSRPSAVDVADSPRCVDVQKLSHYERKMLRRIARLERKEIRLFKDECVLVSR